MKTPDIGQCRAFALVKEGVVIERWYFDEARGAKTVGAMGAVIHLGNTQWTDAGRATPTGVFWSRLQTLCGHAFGGRVTEAHPRTA